jgi:hypothetical protein
MIQRLKNPLRRFRKNEDGSAMMLEFVIFVPLLFTTFLMAVELGVYSMRQMFLDRGLDVAVRHVRLSTNLPIAHDDLKEIICENAGFLEDCQSSLRLEMAVVSPRNFNGLSASVDCIDTAEDSNPVQGFALGREHDLMLLRACVRFDPVFPTSGLGASFDKDGNGKAHMVSMSAFVQEPN